MHYTGISHEHEEGIKNKSNAPFLASKDKKTFFDSMMLCWTSFSLLISGFHFWQVALEQQLFNINVTVHRFPNSKFYPFDWSVNAQQLIVMLNPFSTDRNLDSKLWLAVHLSSCYFEVAALTTGRYTFSSSVSARGKGGSWCIERTRWLVSYH